MLVGAGKYGVFWDVPFMARAREAFLVGGIKKKSMWFKIKSFLLKGGFKLVKERTP